MAVVFIRKNNSSKNYSKKSYSKKNYSKKNYSKKIKVVFEKSGFLSSSKWFKFYKSSNTALKAIKAVTSKTKSKVVSIG